MNRAWASFALLPLLAAATLPSTPSLGVAEGRCRAGERGPAFLVSVEGLKDRRGTLRLEVYPANDADFLADDNVLVAAGKTFRRVVTTIPASGPVELCVRVPGPGRYAVSLLHSREGKRKFNWRSDGVGFAGNPRLGFGKPASSKAMGVARDEPTRIAIVLNYFRGLGMRPLPQEQWSR